jgi:hypothetical protein
MPGGNGRKAAVDNAQSWGSYETACNMQGVDGVGYVLTSRPGLAALDLDHCRDKASGAIEPWAMELIDACNSYVEVTPSQTGLRIIGLADGLPATDCKLPRGPNGQKVEAYVGGPARYITVSFETFGADERPLADIAKVARRLLAERNGAERNGAQPTAINPADLSGLAPDITLLIQAGAPVEADRSRELFRAIAAMRDCGWSRERIIATLRSYPGGIAARCFEGGKDDVVRQVDLCLRKIDDDRVGRRAGQRPSNGAALSLESKPASDYTMRGVVWFWPDRFAIGKIGIIGGLPDKGKGQLAAFLAAACTARVPLPCNEGHAPQGSVIWLNAEDEAEDTVIPRLAAAGADLKRVHLIDAAKNADGIKRMPNLTTDLPALEAKIKELGDVNLIIIDPLSAYLGVGKVNNSSTTDVRGVLGPLKQLAEERRVTIVCIMHFNKKADVTNAMLRIADSLAYVAAARHVYVVVDDADDKNSRLFVKAKNNLAPDKRALRYSFGARKVGYDEELKQDIWAPYVEWHTEPVEITATEAMAAEAGGKRDNPREDAKEILRDRLSAGPVYSTDVIDEAKARGISERTLRRAGKDLGVVIERVDRHNLKSPWQWRMPPEQPSSY